MWKRLGQWVLQFRKVLLIVLVLLTAVMGYFAAQVKLSYEFSKAIPTDNPKLQDYQNFKQKFGDDGNLVMIGVQTSDLFQFDIFKKYEQLADSLKMIDGVESVLSIPGAFNLVKNDSTERLNAMKIFADVSDQQTLNEAASIFHRLPFYINRLYNPDTRAYMMVVGVNHQVLLTKERSILIGNITDLAKKFEKETSIKVRLSGLPLIRTVTADRIQSEMKIFLIASILLSALILFLFFRSVGVMLLSLAVVAIGVIWTVALIPLFGYKITLLTALIPSLVVIIGIPNCIYFINKYHVAYKEKGDKQLALVEMVQKMGVVTLFCNIVAAIGFAVFALTESAILKEFGSVAGLGIMFIFIISFILLPVVLSYMKAPDQKSLRYLTNKKIEKVLSRFQHWAYEKQKAVYITTAIVLAIAIAGLTQLKTVGYIVDDLPKGDYIYRDLKFFEKNFKGVMPLEILIDAKKKNSFTGMKALRIFDKMDTLANFVSEQESMAKPLSLTEGLKFAKQAFYEGDSAQYLLPNSFDGAFVGPYLRPSKSGEDGGVSAMTKSFLDSNRQVTRMSIAMADVGTEVLPMIVDKIEKRTNQIFDSADYKVTFTGTGITFQEGSRFIINGLTESILWAFLLIALCMLYLFKSVKMLFCSLIPNVIPLLITAGVMGWAGVPLKPSTVLVFCVALGIAVDITIRFLVNYKQDLPANENSAALTVEKTIYNTGLSIIYTTLVLIAGFIIFCLSSFGGTFSLGWLTSLTLVIATLTNLILLPVLLLNLSKHSAASKKA